MTSARHSRPLPATTCIGQVAADSSYSSHVLYYPIDEENRAKATIRFQVPDGYVAVGPGELSSKKTSGNKSQFTWVATDGLVKQLPYGWAIAKYSVTQRRSRGRVPIRVYALPGRQAQANRVLKGGGGRGQLL